MITKATSQRTQTTHHSIAASNDPHPGIYWRMTLFPECQHDATTPPTGMVLI